MAVFAAAIPQLAFPPAGAERVEHTAVPTLGFDLRVATADEREIRSVAGAGTWPRHGA